MEIQLCIGTEGEFPIQPYEMPVCPWHRKVVSQLDSGDAVVSFNYDLVLPYALLNEKKLSTASFLNPYIKEVDISKELSSEKPVVFITPHGSFIWHIRNKLNYYDCHGKFHHSEQFFEVTSKINYANLANMSAAELADLNFRMDPPHIRVNLNNNPCSGYELSKVILPLQKKKQILDDMPHFKEEYNMFLKKLKQADEIYLIGKNFKFSDQDIALDIKETCAISNNKHIVYINPQSIGSQGEEWVDYHNCIFNVRSHETYRDLPEYIDKKR